MAKKKAKKTLKKTQKWATIGGKKRRLYSSMNAARGAKDRAPRAQEIRKITRGGVTKYYLSNKRR